MNGKQAKFLRREAKKLGDTDNPLTPYGVKMAYKNLKASFKKRNKPLAKLTETRKRKSTITGLPRKVLAYNNLLKMYVQMPVGRVKELLQFAKGEGVLHPSYDAKLASSLGVR